MRDTKTGMMFAHHVPKKGMSNAQGAREIIKAEVARIREKETVLENSPVGDSKQTA